MNDHSAMELAEAVTAAVTDALSQRGTEDWPANTQDAVRGELVDLWYDLHQARRSAYNGVWSIQCGDLVARIMKLTALVGPTPWEQLQIDLVEDGVYQQVLAALGLAVDVDMAAVAEHRRYIGPRVVGEGR